MEQRFFDVAGFKVVIKTGTEVSAKFFPASERGGDGEDQEPAGARVEAGTSPDGAPGVARDQGLKVAREVSGSGVGGVDISVAQDAAAHLIGGRERGRQEIEERRCERARAFDVRKMRGRESDDFRAGDFARENLAVSGPGGADVVVADDDQGWFSDFRERGRVVHVADGPATAGIALRIRVEECAAQRADARVWVCESAGGERAFEKHAAQRGHSVGEHGLFARVPIGWRACVRRGVREDQMG